MEYVYGVRCGDYVKIGYTTNPMARLIDLPDSVICPDDLDLGQELEVLFLVAGDRETEALLHQLLAHAWVAGEWFRWSEVSPALGEELPKDIVRVQPRGRSRRRAYVEVVITDEQRAKNAAWEIERARLAAIPIDF
jgi:hypothetical protein